MRTKKENNKSIKRLVIIGNGFDLAHNMRTSYGQFAESFVDNEYIKAFKKLAEETCLRENWYEFEQNIETIASNKYSDAICCADNGPSIQSINNMFCEIELCLKKYLIAEYNRKPIKLMTNVNNYFDSETFTVSFNYTDTVKLYTDNYDFVHGSINDDDYIILGFAYGDYPCLATGDFTKYDKPRLREVLNFLRYVKNKYGNVNIQTLVAFEEQVDSLYSGRGEYAIEKIKNYSIEDRRIILEYIHLHKKAPFEKEYPLENVEEIVIMGHSLETDFSFLSNMFDRASNLQRVVLFSFMNEREYSIQKKKKRIKELARRDIGIKIEMYI